MMELYGCNEEKINDFKNIYKILEELPEKIQMEKLTIPYVVPCKPNIKTFDKGGISGFVMITTSHISIHTFSKERFVSFDIFSCKKFNTEKAIGFVKRNLEPKKIEKRLIQRGKYFTK